MTNDNKDNQNIEENQDSVESILPEEVENLENDNSDELTSLKDTVIRLTAENQNLLKRIDKEVLQAKKGAIRTILKDIVSPVESVYSAIKMIEKQKIEKESQNETIDEFSQSILSGLNLIVSDFEKMMQKYSIVRISPLNEIYDYNKHEVLSQIPNDEVEENTVLDVIQAGYMVADMLVKPAMVIVSKKSE